MAWPAAYAGLARADFNDLLGADNAPQTGEGGGIGWADVWGADPNQQTGAIKIGAGDLVAPPSTNFNVPQLQPGDAGYTSSHNVYGESIQERGNTRQLASTMSGEIWFSYLIYQRSGAGFGGLFFPSQYSYEPDSKPRAQISGQGELSVSINGVDKVSTATGVVPVDATNLIVGRIVVGPGGAGSTIDAWLNPDVSQGAAGLAAAPTIGTTGQLADSFIPAGYSSIGHVGVLGWNHSGGTFVDHLSISDTATAFQDVTGHPFGEAEGLPGDFDGDEDVDGEDLAQWEGDFGGPGSDADGDNDSDGNDFLIWQRNITGPLADAAAAPVPEPATSILALAAALAVVFRRRRGY